jgi:hypothetical protein
MVERVPGKSNCKSKIRTATYPPGPVNNCILPVACPMEQSSLCIWKETDTASHLLSDQIIYFESGEVALTSGDAVVDDDDESPGGC